MAKFFKIPFAATGDILAVPDATQPDGSVSYSQGFGPDYQRKTDGTDPLAKTVPRNSTNALFNDLTGAVGEIQLNGVPAWQSVGAPYPINAIVRYNNKNWISQVANNSATPVEGASWSELPANSYTKAQVDTKLATKANSATTIAGYGITDAYTKAQVDSSLSGKANVSTTIAGYGITDAYTKTQTDSLLASKANNATTLSGYGITDAYTKTQVDTALSGKANTATTLGGYGISDAYTKTEGDARYLRISNNLSEITGSTNRAAARANLSLGTSATADVVSGVSDTTSGRVLTVGYGGLGAQLQSGTESLDAETITRFRAYGTSTVGAPTTNGGAAVVISRAGSPTILAVDYVTGDFYFRPINSTYAWRKLFHSSNVSAYIQTLFPASDASAARSILGIVEGVGNGQSWSVQSRATGTTYTNTTGRPIAVSIRMLTSSSSNNASLLVAGVTVAACGTPLSNTTLTLQAIIPTGATYALNASNSPVQEWTELR